MNNLILVYHKTTGLFMGFYDSSEINNLPEIFADEIDELSFNYVTPEIHKYILSLKFNPATDSIIDVSKISDETIIDSEDYIIVPPDKAVDIELIRTQLIRNIKGKCKAFIVNGREIVLSSGDKKFFTYEIEDQINLSEFKNNHSSGDIIYYHAKGEYKSEYSYEDICLIYKELYNNKLYNLIYTQVVCDWIYNHYTLDMYDNKEVIDYGWCNDDILNEVTEIYEDQKIS